MNIRKVIGGFEKSSVSNLPDVQKVGPFLMTKSKYITEFNEMVAVNFNVGFK